MLDTACSDDRSDVRITDRMRARWRGHAVTGALLLFFFATLFGFPDSLLPLALLQNLFGSALLGAPLGYAISRAGGGVGRGAAVGAGALAAVGLVQALIAGASLLGALLPMAKVAASGMVIGAFLGWHVEQDR